MYCGVFSFDARQILASDLVLSRLCAIYSYGRCLSLFRTALLEFFL